MFGKKQPTTREQQRQQERDDKKKRVKISASDRQRREAIKKEIDDAVKEFGYFTMAQKAKDAIWSQRLLELNRRLSDFDKELRKKYKIDNVTPIT